MTPSEIEAYGPEAFLRGDNFQTDRDTRDLEPFKKGLQIGHDADEIHIAINGTWIANMKDGRAHSTHERIGITPDSRWLYQGLLDSKVPIIVHRMQNGKMKHYALIVVDGVRIIREQQSARQR